MRLASPVSAGPPTIAFGAHGRRGFGRLLAFGFAAGLLAALAGPFALDRAQAEDRVFRVNSDLLHIVFKGSPLNDGDCDKDPPPPNSFELQPPPGTCTLGGALREAGAVAGHHTVVFDVPVIPPAGVIAEFTSLGDRAVTIQGPVTIDMSEAGSNPVAIGVKDVAGIAVKDVWIKGTGAGDAKESGIVLTGAIPLTTTFPCELDGVVITGVATALSIGTDHVCNLTNSRIGIDPSGAAVANTGGIHLRGDGLQVLDNAIATSLAITGNDGVVRGNKVGTDSAATRAVGDSSFAIRIEGDGNVVEGNVVATGFQGGFVEGDATMVIRGDRNSLLKNRIGTTEDGAAILGSTQHGLLIAGSGNCIGELRNPLFGCGGPLRPFPPTTGANVISGNGGNGVIIADGRGNVVTNNVIGLNLAQDTALGNAYSGILLSNNPWLALDPKQVAGVVKENVIRGNVISANGEGIRLDPGANDNTIDGNFIGTNGAGSAGLGNKAGGVVIRGGSGNVVGGARPSERCTGSCNLISGNGADGVAIFDTQARGNRVLGNFIGTDVAGAVAIPNDHTRDGGIGASSNGVFLAFGASENNIGGAGEGEGNLISGNHENGVHINGPLTTGNVVEGNFIGTDVTRARALANRLDGVHIHDARENVVGAAGFIGNGNVVSGNARNGVQIHAGAKGNLVRGNLIGTDGSGEAAVPNTEVGVVIEDAAENMVGGASLFHQNVISGNGGAGLMISGQGAENNVVDGNYIGTNRGGASPLANGADGVVLAASAPGNLVGVSKDPFLGLIPIGEGNVISGNTGNGVRIQNGAFGNTVRGNKIGVDTNGERALGNGVNGVLIEASGPGGTQPDRNVIGHGGLVALGTTAFANVIAHNARAGVRIEHNAGTYNVVGGNSIHSNGELGIDVAAEGVTERWPAPSPTLPALVLTSADTSSIEGRVTGSPGTRLLVEFFANEACDPSGHGEGESFVDIIEVTMVVGVATFVARPPFRALVPEQFVTATATDPVDGTSEFSRCMVVAPPGATTTGSITGTVLLQGRTSAFPVGGGHSAAQVASDSGRAPQRVDRDGGFVFANVLAGTYALTAFAPGYLPATHDGVEVAAGREAALLQVELRAGLVNGDNVVDIADIEAVASALGARVSNGRDRRGQVVDINGDGAVDVLDLALVASNFGRSSPQPWP